MIKEKYETLISKLIVATANGNLTWEKTSSRNEFQVKLGNNGVSISYYDPEKYGYLSGIPVNNQKPSVSLEVINSDGKEIDGETIEKGQKDYERLLDLYKEARRQCLHVDETLDEILKSL